MKKPIALVLSLLIIAVQFVFVIPALAGETTLLATYTAMSWNSSAKGYKVETGMAADNENFTNILKFTVTDKNTFNGAAKDPTFYQEALSDKDINDWNTNPDAELRFWIKTPETFTASLRLVHNNGYKRINYTLSVDKGDKWQEIRIKRSEFDNSADFDTRVAGGEGKVAFQMILPQNVIDVGDEMLLGPVEFYNGEIKEDVDPDGGTIDLTPKEGKKIATYMLMSWNASNKGYKVATSTVTDNENFTNILKFTVTDVNTFNGAAKDPTFYQEALSDEDILDWNTNPNAELRFWIKTPKAFTASLRLVHNNGYKRINYALSVPASETWQEIRIKRSDFDDSTDFNTRVASGEGKVAFQMIMNPNIIGVDEEILLGPVEFYDGLVPGEIDPDGGTIVVVPTEGEKITEYNSMSWNASNKGYLVAETAVSDNKNFKSGVEFTITDMETYNAGAKDPTFFHENVADANITEWNTDPNAELRFWIKTPKAFTATMRIAHNTGYKRIIYKVSIPASENWQEIRIKRSDFDSNPEFDALISSGAGASTIQFLMPADVISADESIIISPIEFYDGYIPGEIDPSGGTVIIPNIPGELINTIPAAVIKQVSGTQSQIVSVYDNDFVSQAVKFTVTDEEAFYKTNTQLTSNSLAKPGNIKGWYDYQKAEIRFWVKVPHAMKFKIQLVESYNSTWPYIETEIEIPYAESWQKIVIPRSQFTTNSLFTAEHTQYMRIMVSDKNKRDEYLKFCDSIYLSQVEVYNGIIQPSADIIDNGKAGNMFHKVDLVPFSNNGLAISKVDVDDNKNFKKGVTVEVENARSFATTEGSYLIHNSTNFDISKWYQNPNAELRFWIRTDKDLTLRFGLQNPGSDKPSSYRAIWAQLSVKGSDNWQEIRLSRKHFGDTANFDPTIIKYIKLMGSADNTITTNETVYVGPVEFYDGYIAAAVDSNGGTTKAHTENAVISTFSSYSPKLTGENITAENIAVDTNRYFVKAVNFAASAGTKFTSTLKTFYDTYDISRGKNGMLRLWVKSGKAISFDVVLTDISGKTVTLPFKSVASADWQELRVKLSGVNTSGFDFTKLFSVGVSGNFAAGDVLQIGKMELWQKNIEAAIDSTGGTIAPPPVLPPVWAELPDLGKSEENEILIRTGNDFWMNDWNANRERAITAVNVGVDKKDPKYSWFAKYKQIKVVNEDVYYSSKTSATQGPSTACFYWMTITDISGYLKSGTLRFWINVPKDMTVRLYLTSYDPDKKYTRAYVDVAVKKTEENDGFSEIQIPLKDFYDSAVKTNTKWNPYYIRFIELGPVDNASKNNYLAKDEALCVSQFEIWKAQALEPEPYDPTRYFYSLRGEIFVKDINDVLAKTAVVNAFKNSLELDAYKKIASKYFDKAELKELYTVNLVSSSDYDYKTVTAYDEVWMYIPISEGLNTDNLKIAIYNNTGIYECEYEIVDGHFIITTKQFGEVMLLSGGKRNETVFDHSDDMAKVFGLIEGKKTAVSQKESSSVVTTLLIVGAIIAAVCAVLAVVIVIIKKKKKA